MNSYLDRDDCMMQSNMITTTLVYTIICRHNIQILNERLHKMITCTRHMTSYKVCFLILPYNGDAIDYRATLIFA